MGISSERKRFLFISRGSNICLFSVDHHLSARVRVGSAVISTTSLCLLARTAAHCWGAGCRPEKQHSDCVCVCVCVRDTLVCVMMHRKEGGGGAGVVCGCWVRQCE